MLQFRKKDWRIFLYQAFYFEKIWDTPRGLQRSCSMFLEFLLRRNVLIEDFPLHWDRNPLYFFKQAFGYNYFSFLFGAWTWEKQCIFQGQLHLCWCSKLFQVDRFPGPRVVPIVEVLLENMGLGLTSIPIVEGFEGQALILAVALILIVPCYWERNCFSICEIKIIIILRSRLLLPKF